MDTPFIIDRSILENQIWYSVAEFRTFFLILGNARFKHETIKIGDIEIGRGQWLRSYRNLQKDLEYKDNKAVKQYSISNIKKICDKLERDGRVSLQRTELGTLFTVVNYAKYQDLSNYKKANRERDREQIENSTRTVREQSENNTIKDIKEIKEIKNKNMRKIEDFPLEVRNVSNIFAKTLSHKNLIPTTTTDKIKWLDAIDKCHRIDGYTYEQIIEIIQQYRIDPFWGTKFLAPAYLRKKSADGVKYIDRFYNEMTASPTDGKDAEERKRIKRNEEILRKAREELNDNTTR